MYLCLEYGVLHSWKCNRPYRLIPEKLEGDLHYLHKNGKLYMNEKDPLDTDSYCIENINTPTGAIEVSYFQMESVMFSVFINICYYSPFFFLTGTYISLSSKYNISATRQIFLLSLWFIDILCIFGHNINCLSISAKGFFLFSFRISHYFCSY